MNNSLNILNENSYFAQQKAKAQLDEIEKQRKLLEKKKEIIEKTKEEIEESKRKGEYDWTRSYKMWDVEIDEDYANRLSEEENCVKKGMESAVSNYQSDHHIEIEFNKKSVREKLDMCDEARRKGKAFYEEGLYARAAGQYRLATAYCEYITVGKDEKEYKEYEDTLIHCSLNLAQCKLKTEEYNEVINLCNIVIDYDESNFIAYFRKGIANRSMHRFDEAKNDFEMALKYVKEKGDEIWNKKIQKEYDVLKYMIKSANIKEKKVSKRMFNNEEDDKKRKVSEDGYINDSKKDSSFYDCRIKSEENNGSHCSDINITSNSSSSIVLKYVSTLFYTLQLIILSFIHGFAFVIYKTFRCCRCKSNEEENEDVIESEYRKENFE